MSLWILKYQKRNKYLYFFQCLLEYLCPSKKKLNLCVFPISYTCLHVIHFDAHYSFATFLSFCLDVSTKVLDSYALYNMFNLKRNKTWTCFILLNSEILVFHAINNFDNLKNNLINYWQIY